MVATNSTEGVVGAGREGTGEGRRDTTTGDSTIKKQVANSNTPEGCATYTAQQQDEMRPRCVWCVCGVSVTRRCGTALSLIAPLPVCDQGNQVAAVSREAAAQATPGLAPLRRRVEAVEKGLATSRHAAASKADLSEVCRHAVHAARIAAGV